MLGFLVTVGLVLLLWLLGRMSRRLTSLVHRDPAPR